MFRDGWSNTLYAATPLAPGPNRGRRWSPCIGEVFARSDTTNAVTTVLNYVLRTARSRDVTPRNNKLQTSRIRSGYLRQLNRLIGERSYSPQSELAGT